MPIIGSSALKKPSYWGQGKSGGQPYYGGEPAEETAPDILERVTKPKAGFNDPGGTGDKLRDLAASLMSAGGNEEGSNDLLQQIQARQQDEMRRQQFAQEQEYRQAMLARQNRPSVVNLGGGGVATFDDATGALNVIRQPDAQPTPSSENERLIDRWKKLPPNDPERALIERTLRGYQYTQPVLQAQQAGRMAVHQAPTYSNLHPGAGGVSPTKRADLIGQAQQAIARGADPVKVHARLAQMGVTF